MKHKRDEPRTDLDDLYRAGVLFGARIGGEQAVSESDESPVFEEQRVIATYQHIREHWPSLRSVDAARIKAARAIKRGNWLEVPKNHPSEKTWVSIPCTDWNAATEQPVRRERVTAVPAEQGDHDRGNNNKISALSNAVDVLREQLRRSGEIADRAEAARAEAVALKTAAEAEVQRHAEAASKAEVELTRLRIEQETIQRLGLLGRLAWALRGGSASS
jgi:hypothetical protein